MNNASTAIVVSESAVRAAGVVVDREPDPDVQHGLDKTEKGKPVASIRNVAHVLQHDERWTGRLQWSEFNDEAHLDGAALTDDRETELAIWLDDVYALRAAPENLHRAMVFVARRNPYDPVRSYLEGLTWDGVPRLAGLLPTYFSAEDTPLNRRFGVAFMVSAVARVFRPGCKVDTMLVLIGGQGQQKSTAVGALMPRESWFADTKIDLSSKDAYMLLTGVWVYEVAELNALSGASNEAVKAWLSSRVDRYRRPYGRHVEAHPRRVVLIGTGNRDEFLTDDTGGRRFWPSRVGAVDVAGIIAIRDQLWAEAVARFRAGETWWLTREEEGWLKDAQLLHQEPDAWEPRLEAWVAHQDAPFTVEQALGEALGLPFDRWDKRVRQRVGRALARLGCTKTRPRSVEKARAWCWERPARMDRGENDGAA
jgi:putative DNA primase/helicase